MIVAFCKNIIAFRNNTMKKYYIFINKSKLFLKMEKIIKLKLVFYYSFNM